MSIATLRGVAQRYGTGDVRAPGPATGPAAGPSATAGEGGDAITMPPAFGLLVQAELSMMMLAGPVVAGPPEEPLTFLTRPANLPSPTVPADLLPLGVRLVPAGSRIPLPEPSGLRSWVTAPVAGGEPAIWSAVIGAARRVAWRLASCR